MQRSVHVASTLLTSLAAVAAIAADQSSPPATRQRPRAITAQGLRAPGTADRSRARLRSEELYARLMADQVETALAEPLTVTVSARDLETIRSGRCEDCAATPFRQLVGVEESVARAVDLANLAGATAKRMPRPTLGAIRSAGGVEYVWTLAIRSPGATGLRVHFADFTLPTGSELYLYTLDGQAFGPYMGEGPLGTGEFWSHTVSGDLALLQLHWSGVDMDGSLRSTYFEIANLGVMGPWYTPVARPAGSVTTKAFCSYNASCVVNASCATIPGAVAPARDAAAFMLFVSGRYYYICTGSLVADSPGSGIPYFLTAHHCISRSREASSLEAYFQYSVDCGSACPDQTDLPPPDTRTLGSSVLATGSRGDFTLLELDQAPPAGTYLLGWSALPVALNNGVDLYRISHPMGAPQSFSEQAVSTSSPACGGLPRGDFIYSRDTLGATEGGSSGSAVLDDQGRIVGQLYGACGTNLNDVCDAQSNATVDGAFASYFDQVAQWLDPVTCTDSDNDGWCDQDDCAPDDPAINPGASEICDDGLDNDCDGLIDAADPDCQVGSCDLQPKGAACSSDADCCSNKCRGKPGAKTCR